MTPPMADPFDDPKSIATLRAIMKALRTPGTGCPWDLEQTFETIAPYTIEEAYEVADAVDRGDLDDLKEELGDLQLQVVYHAQMAEEKGAFAFEDVVEAINAKLVRRHPHVFGDEEARTADAVTRLWELGKAAEHAEKRARQRSHGVANDAEPGLLDGFATAIPALMRAVKLQSRAARVGFDWDAAGPVLDKAEEELGELREALEGAETDRARAAEEVGDLLFAIANLARHLDVDPEDALRRANQKFVRRFSYIEKALAAQGKTPETAELAEMDRLWDEAKQNGL